MSAVEQLDYVEKHIFSHNKKPKTLHDLYMSVLWPIGIGKSNDSVLWSETGKHAGQYKVNSGLDINKDGQITKAEAVQKVIDRRDGHFEKKK